MPENRIDYLLPFLAMSDPSVRASSESAGDWVCEACTLRNVGPALACSACARPRSSAPAVLVPPASPTSSDDAASASEAGFGLPSPLPRLQHVGGGAFVPPASSAGGGGFAPAVAVAAEPSPSPAPAAPPLPPPSCGDRLALLVATKARLLNAAAWHIIILFVLFTHYLYVAIYDALDPASDDPGPIASGYAYFARLWIPQVEFALMFMLLWSMIMLPLTMMRYTAARLASTSAARWLPLSALQELHIFVGGHMLAQLALVLCLFCAWFGVMCVAWENGTQSFHNFCTGPEDDGSKCFLGA